ncbi:MAG: hypothetical protein DLM62_03500 [Pseudonocardiales bacterium]|nr:MAG: hypothetical protein DLM62_03500 [Pseudonocardiales bacterium]
MAATVVSYELDDKTVVRFEIEPTADFRPAGPDEIAGRIRDAVAPAVEGASTVLETVKEAAPDEIVVKCGIKVIDAVESAGGVEQRLQLVDIVAHRRQRRQCWITPLLGPLRCWGPRAKSKRSTRPFG